MKLSKLFKGIDLIQIRGSKEIEITGLSSNSKNIAPGFLFIAKRGKTFDGAKFIPEVVQGGAVAVLTDTYDPFIDITQIVHPNPPDIELMLAERFYQAPTQHLHMIGVTGTNGKTTTTYLIKYFLEQHHKRCGLIGTVEWSTGQKVYPSMLTTPDTLTLTRFFSEMVHAKAFAAIMEVSSHALHQQRTQGIDFQIGVFTNLTQDHLDYHQTMEHYAGSKALLFRSLSSSAWAVINKDDPASTLMIQACKAHLLSYGMSPAADLYATELHMTPQGMTFEVHHQGKKETFHTQLIGRFNVDNILAATAVALVQGITLTEVREALISFTGVPGRLERVLNQKNLQIFVDYSHTPDSLEKALKTLQELKPSRLIVVYGCGGNRDALKRPLMGAIAEKFSDISILTSDNPRKEDPAEIARQVLKGCQQPTKTIVELDRCKAIEKAIDLATPSDMILIAGKGHETTQIFAHQTIHFDDRLVARAVLEKQIACEGY